MLAPLAVARAFITIWEDGGSIDPRQTHSVREDDGGNWTGGVCGRGACVGSNHGVTARTLARARGVAAESITKAVMRALTLDEAARIAVRFFYEQNGLNRLPWDQVMASVFDFGWGAGPTETVIHLQRFVGARDDAHAGPATAQAYVRYIAAHGVEGAANAWADRRAGFYRSLVAHDPRKAVFLKGWLRRTDSYRPTYNDRPAGAMWRAIAAPA